MVYRDNIGTDSMECTKGDWLFFLTFWWGLTGLVWKPADVIKTK